MKYSEYFFLQLRDKSRLLFLIAGFSVLSSLCFGQTGKDGAKTVNASTVVNEYTLLTLDANAGATAITVGTSSLNAGGLFAGALAPGDLLFIIQMQGATLGANNDSTFGEILNYGNAGHHELAQVLSVPSITSIQLSCPLQKNYSASGKTQIVRVPRYSSLTVNGGGVLTCPSWNGSTGGVLVIEVLGNTVINSGARLDANGRGFRGGALLDNDAWWGVLNFVSTRTDYGAEKGESIGGYQSDYDALGGRYCKGAAANGGGGANAHNAGGGGGGNASSLGTWTGRGNPDVTNASWASAWNLEYSGFASSSSPGGGRGGFTFSASNQNALTAGPGDPSWGGDNRRDNGGLGGRPLDYSSGRIFAGGGGGSGDQNDSKGGSGGSGGGIIYFMSYGDISGSGAIQANGANGANTLTTNGTDGAGGGGGGGAVIVNCLGLISGISVNANGGNGGSQIVAALTLEAEGPGGGGGGGYIAITNGMITRTANGGNNGVTNSLGLTEFPPNGATKGGDGSAYNLINSYKINIQSPQIVCANVARTLSFTTTGTVPPGTIFNWYSQPVGGAVLATGSSFTTPALSSTTTYYIGTCPGHYRVPVRLEVDVVNASFSSTSVCQGLASTFTASGTSSWGVITSWNWNFGDGVGSSAVQSPVYTYGAAGTYTATLVATDNNGCSISVNSPVIVHPKPTISISAPVVSGCNPLTVNFVNNSTNAGSYSWNFGDGSPASSAISPSHVYTQAGNYTVSLSASNSFGCTASQSFTGFISVAPTPLAGLNITSPLCQGDTLFPSNTSSANGSVITSYSWNFGDGSPAVSGFAPYHVFVSSGNYTVSLTTSAGSCSHTASSGLVVAPGPQAGFSTNLVSGCAPLSIVFSNTTIGSATYSWDFGDGSPMSLQTSPTHVYSSPGTYSITMIAAAGSCSDTILRPAYIQVHPQPIASFASVSQICLGDTVYFTNNSLGNGSTILSYQWNFGDGSPFSAQTHPYYVYAAPGTYTVNLNTQTAFCNDQATATIVVAPAPVAGFSLLVSQGCAPFLAGFTNTSSGNPVFTWNFGDGSAGSSLAHPNHQYTNPGSYTVTLIAVTGGCSDTLIVPSAVQVLPTPQANFTFTSACLGDSVRFINTTQANGSPSLQYSWNFNDGSPVDFRSNPSHLYAAAGSYSVQLITQSSNSCTDTVINTVIVQDRPSVNFSTSAVKGCDSLTVQFVNTSSGANSYNWNFGDGGNSLAVNPVHFYSSAGIYSVLLTASGNNGCSASRAFVNLIEVYASPAVQFQTSNTTLCKQSCTAFTDLSASSVNGWLWTFPGASPGGAAVQHPGSVCYNQEGWFDVSLTVNDAHCSSTLTKAAYIHVVDCSQLPVASFISSDSAFCEGACVNFVSLSQNASFWNWSFPGATPSASTQESPTSICYNLAGTYPVRLIAGNPGGSDTLEVNAMIVVSPAPSAPVITQNGNILSSSPAVAYQWFRNGVAISGSTGQNFLLSLPGNYQVEITDANGCSAMSPVYQVLTVGLEDIVSEVLGIYPNPFNSLLFIDISPGFRENVRYFRLLDALGRQVYIRHVKHENGSGPYLLNVPALTEGVYFLETVFENGINRIRLIRQY